MFSVKSYFDKDLGSYVAYISGPQQATKSVRWTDDFRVNGKVTITLGNDFITTYNTILALEEASRDADDEINLLYKSAKEVLINMI